MGRGRLPLWATVLQEADGLAGRVLVVQGAVDPLIAAAERAGELRQAASRAHVDVVHLEGGNHYFDDRHEELAACIVAWLAGGDDEVSGAQRR